MRGATHAHRFVDLLFGISIHAPHAGRDGSAKNSCCKAPAFQSTRPMRGATGVFARFALPGGNFNPRAPCGARRVPILSRFRISIISIHAPHAGRDYAHRRRGHRQQDFNPRAPCGARRFSTSRSRRRKNFNPRAPCGARLRRFPRALRAAHFNPRAPCGARLDTSLRIAPSPKNFNPRAPCGARPAHNCVRDCVHDFNPRAPCGARRRGSARPR